MRKRSKRGITHHHTLNILSHVCCLYYSHSLLLMSIAVWRILFGHSSSTLCNAAAAFQLTEIVLMKITRLRSLRVSVRQQSFVSTFHEWKESECKYRHEVKDRLRSLASCGRERGESSRNPRATKNMQLARSRPALWTIL